MDVTFGDPVFLASESGENLPGEYHSIMITCAVRIDEIRADHTPRMRLYIRPAVRTI